MKQKIIAINSPKGGVGKSTIAKELAGIYASKTWNKMKIKVLLIDLDLEFGSISSLLKIKSSTTILSWITNIQQRLIDDKDQRISYSQEFVEEHYMYNYSENFKVLTAPIRPDEALKIKDEELKIMISNIRNFDYDVVIIDTGNNSNDYTLIALSIADLILNIVTLDITSINCTQKFLDLLENINFPLNKLFIIVNKIPPKVLMGNTSEIGEIKQTLKKDVVGLLPDYPQIRVLNNSGDFSKEKLSDFHNSLNQMAYDLFPVFDITPQVYSTKKKGLLKRLFRR